jgi:FkbM family methyltransferase
MSLATLESLLRRTANRCGIDIKRYRPEGSETGRLAAMLRHHQVNLVLDVGANVGQFAQGLRRGGYTGRMVSFEPMQDAHRQLRAAARSDPKWEIAAPVAIGDHEGEIDLHVAGNSVSSSVLEMLDSHSIAAPESSYVTSERVRVSTLDFMTRDKIGTDDAVFLKIDTQGYEDRVLDGAKAVLAKARGLQLELSFVALYDGQQLFHPLMDRLRAIGFSPWAIWPGFCDPASGRMLQVDVALFRD